MVFMQRQRMKGLLLRAHIGVRTSKMKISRRHLADYVKNCTKKRAARLFSPNSTNQIIDFITMSMPFPLSFLKLANDESKGIENVTNLHCFLNFLLCKLPSLFGECKGLTFRKVKSCRAYSLRQTNLLLWSASFCSSCPIIHLLLFSASTISSCCR